MEAMTQRLAFAPDRILCKELVERVCVSNEIRRAARLKDFLRYVAGRALEDGGSPITEQEIGVHVFDRPQNYDTGIDNIVRVNASELRKRLHQYFERNGAVEPIHFHIPRGTYTPQFFPRPIDVREETASVTRGEVLVPSETRRRGLVPMLAAATCILLAVCVFLLIENRAIRRGLDPWRSEPTLRPFWSEILDANRNTDIVMADTSFVIAEDMLHRQLPLSSYLRHDFIDQWGGSLGEPLRSELQNVALRGNGSFGDFKAVRRILALAPHSDTLRLEYARHLPASALTRDNLIFVGSSYSNPWVQLFENQVNFRLVTDPVDKHTEVMNAKPAPGEEAVYRVAPAVNGGPIGGYAIVQFFLDHDRKSNIVILAGTTSESTEAAGNFITSEASMAQLKAILKVRQLHHFEALLKTTKLDNTPLSAEILAAHAID